MEDHYTLGSTDGPVTSVKIRCPQGHWFSGPLGTLAAHTAAAPGAAAVAAPVASS